MPTLNSLIRKGRPMIGPRPKHGIVQRSFRMKRYELWWATLPAPAGRRPVLLLGHALAWDELIDAA